VLAALPVSLLRNLAMAEVLWCPCCGERGSKGEQTFHHCSTRGASLGSTGDARQHSSKQVVGPKYIAGCQKIPKDCSIFAIGPTVQG